MSAGQFYVVIWGDNARLSSKCGTKNEAALQTYGARFPDMKIIPVGTVSKQAVSKYEKLMKEKNLSGH